MTEKHLVVSCSRTGIVPVGKHLQTGVEALREGDIFSMLVTTQPSCHASYELLDSVVISTEGRNLARQMEDFSVAGERSFEMTDVAE